MMDESNRDASHYDSSEAIAILLRGHERRDPARHYRNRHAAAVRLIQAVVEAASAAGYEVVPERGGYVISHVGKGAVYLSERENIGEPFLVSVNGGLPQKLAIEYDAGFGVFVGEQEDSFLVPVPGAPKRRQSAVAVIATAICEMIDRPSAGKVRVR